jgi:hypothetical protein
MATALSRALLNARATEVRAYVAFVQAALERDAAVSAPAIAAPYVLDIELTHTLKANTYLLLYNVVEATMAQLLEDIHRGIRNSGANLDELLPQLYLHVLNRFRQAKPDIGEANMPAPVASSMVSLWLFDYERRAGNNENYLISGNVDSKKIRDIGRKYGFVSSVDGQDSHLGHPSLLRTKSLRNSLAHGALSFADSGRDLAFSDLRSDAEELLGCLDRVVTHVDNYLARQLFLRANWPLQGAPAQPPLPI